MIQSAKGKYRISTATRKVYDTTESRKYCGNDCHIASDYYASQLSATAVFMRTPPYVIFFVVFGVKSNVRCLRNIFSPNSAICGYIIIFH